MADGTARPVIFISYSHMDEPEHPREGEVQWLSFVRTYLQPAIKNGIFDLFVDEHLPGGADLKPEIERKLRACDVFILLISANSTSSDYIVDTEIKVTRDRESNEEDVCFYPVLLTPTPKVALDKFKDKVIRPHDAKPLSSFAYGERIQKMTEIADEIAEIAAKIVSLKPEPPRRGPQPSYVHISGLPETPYERLVGRDTELKCLDDAWTDDKTNILSLIAEGGAGKSALVNEWLKRLQADNYRGAETVLGWSFYSQGSKERATSADEFLNWALDKLSIEIETTSATTKGDAIAEELAKRRVMLVLDGAEPLQHGLDTQLGQLKDLGLRALLRRFAATSAAEAHGLIVLTSRLAVKDIARWQDGAAPIVNVERLSDEAGAALLRDNGVWGADRELKATAHEFEGHPLALDLLASFLKETQFGDVRRRDHVRAYLADPDNPRHDHAKRVMESYENEWLARQPVLLAIMQMVGIFDRPASRKCLFGLRRSPVIDGLTDRITNLDDKNWQRAVFRLREVRLLAPSDKSEPGSLDAHPLVREWFGEKLRQTNSTTWKAAHSRLYEPLRDTTKEKRFPRLKDLAPLYQAIAHGCQADRFQDALNEIYRKRISQIYRNGELKYYSIDSLGAIGSDLAALSWFFDKPYEVPASSLSRSDQMLVQGTAGSFLRILGRVTESIPTEYSALKLALDIEDWVNSAIGAFNLMLAELHAGELANAEKIGAQSVIYAKNSADKRLSIDAMANHAFALFAMGRRVHAKELFDQCEQIQKQFDAARFLYTDRGHHYCELLLANGEWQQVYDRAIEAMTISEGNRWVVHLAQDNLSLGRALVGISLENHQDDNLRRSKTRAADEEVSTGLSRVFVPRHKSKNCRVDLLRALASAETLETGQVQRATLTRLRRPPSQGRCDSFFAIWRSNARGSRSRAWRRSHHSMISWKRTVRRSPSRRAPNRSRS